MSLGDGDEIPMRDAASSLLRAKDRVVRSRRPRGSGCLPDLTKSGSVLQQTHGVRDEFPATVIRSMDSQNV